MNHVILGLWAGPGLLFISKASPATTEGHGADNVCAQFSNACKKIPSFLWVYESFVLIFMALLAIAGRLVRPTIESKPCNTYH